MINIVVDVSAVLTTHFHGSSCDIEKYNTGISMSGAEMSALSTHSRYRADRDKKYEIYTNGIYGYLNKIGKLEDEYSDYGDGVNVYHCLDPVAGNFRKEIYKEYKANRGEADERLTSQLALIPLLLSFMGKNVFQVNGYEGDDIVGSVCKNLAKNKNDDIIIVTNDKDIRQLVVSPNIFYLNIRDKSEYDKAYNMLEIKKYDNIYGFQVVDFLSMTGDVSDNITGINGVGSVTASKILNKYNNLDTFINLIEHNKSAIIEDGFKPSLIEKFDDRAKEILRINKTIIKIETGIDYNGLNEVVKNVKDIEKRDMGGHVETKSALSKLDKIHKHMCCSY